MVMTADLEAERTGFIYEHEFDPLNQPIFSAVAINEPIDILAKLYGTTISGELTNEGCH